MSDLRDFSGKNRKFTGTDSIVLPKGTTAQRVAAGEGELRFNTTTNLAEYYDGTNWKPIDSPPVITSFTLDGGSSVTAATVDNEAGGNATIIIAGTSFDTTAGVVTFIPETTGSTVNVVSTTRTSANSFTVTVARSSFDEGDGPYTMKLANGSGLAATLTTAITADNAAPSFATSADTNLGTVQNGDTATQYDANLTTAAATDADGQTLTHSITAGTLPNGMSIEADGTFTGTASSLQTSATVRTFTVSATDGTLTTTRQFKITEVASAYMAGTGGTTLTNGNYKTHIFTSPGTFAVSAVGPLSNSVEYMVVAGGAGGGGGHAGSGGAGGMRFNYPAPATGGLSVSASPGSYPITVGGGGSGKGTGPGNSTSIIGGSGGQSVFSTITSAGGGGGAYSEDTNRPGANANPGGSGGGGGNAGNGGGSGNTPSVSPPQGNNGGGGYGSPKYPGGGGGGRGGAGQTPSSGNANGGTPGDGEGAPLDFLGGPSNAPSYGTPGPSGSSRYFAGGGGGGVHQTNNYAAGGPGGGGRGGSNGPNVPGVAGTTNTGGGGGGTRGGGTSGAGGSGIVAIRYKFQ